MRDLLVTLIVFGSIPFILRRPYIGVLVWSWLSYMNPHRLTWGFAYNMPFAQIVAITLFASLLFSREGKKISVDGLLVIWIMFVIWMSITTLFALNEVAASGAYQQSLKIQLLTLITMLCMSNQKRIDLLIWVICLSIGFFSIKGGFFTLFSGGSYRVYGPYGSFIGENNALALASLMVIPLMYYLRSISTNVWVKRAWAVGVFLSGVSVLGSQSRGALLGIAALAFYFWLQTKSKLITGIGIVLLGVLALSFMPQSWEDRMDSIKNYQDDSSAMGRIRAWKYSIGVANHRLTGGGFNSYSSYNYAKYSSQYVDKAFVAHSIYFSVLGEHGWPGLALFLLILFLTWRNLGRITRLTKNNPDFQNYYILSRMLTLSLIAYMTGGAFLSLAYFDLPWHIVALGFLLKHQLANEQLTKPISLQNQERH